MTTPYYAAGANGRTPTVQHPQQQQQHRPQQPVVVRGHVVQAQHDSPQKRQPPPRFNPLDYGNELTHQRDSLYHPKTTDGRYELPGKERRCQDIFWAILFYAHLAAIAGCTVAYLPRAMSDLEYHNGEGGGGDGQRRRLGAAAAGTLVGHLRRFLQEDGEEGGDNNNNNNYYYNADDDLELDIDPNALVVLICIATLLSLALSSAALTFMMAFAEALIKASLFFNIGLTAFGALASLLVGAFATAIMFLFLTGIMCYYTYRVWARIPFAAANLVTAVTAVRANLGLALYAYIAVVMVFLWTLWWSLASFASLYIMGDCSADGNCESPVNGGILFLFLLSYYWTTQVISNVVHCSTSGTVGTWWYAPSEASGCCSKAVRESYVRSITLSFGSICFASLIVAIIQAIREVIHSLRENGDSFIACCAECLLACIESLVELFNRFALVYCAVHGQSFLSAGRSVMDLFKARGWTTIITDYMVDTVLSMMSIGVGLFVGLLSLIIGIFMHASDQTLAATFFIGMIVGWAVCATLLSVVGSAVNTGSYSIAVVTRFARSSFQTFSHSSLLQ